MASRGPHKKLRWTAAIVVGILLAGCTGNDTTPENARSERTAFVPPEVTEHANDWPLPGRDYANSRARTDSTITAANIDRLEVAWSVPLPGAAAFGNAATTPLIVGDTVYVQDLQSNVRAIALANGRVRWTRTYDQFQIGPNGVAVGYGRVYAAKSSEEIVALDAETGEELWSTELPRTETEGIDIQPTVVAGLVLAATVPISLDGQYRGGDRGVLWALDAKTGERVWTFDTVKSPDLWGNPEVNSGGGAWYPPAIDVERGLVYWGIANPAPFPGTPEFPNGSSRPGPNLYTESVVALRIKSGRLAWYHQAVPHDLFDRDVALTAIATRAGGSARELVVATGKLGRVIALDPGTGRLVSDAPVGQHRNDELTELTGPTTVLPGLFGGVLTPPSVADGIVYSAVVNAPSEHEPEKENFLGGAELGVMPGQVVAVDAATGAVQWDTQIDGDPLGGTLVVGDLVLTGTFRGKIVAINRATGAIVRTFDAPGGINGWPAATRDTIVWPIGMASPPALVAYRLAPG
jgi:glucose dehydrogenase